MKKILLTIYIWLVFFAIWSILVFAQMSIWDDISSVLKVNTSYSALQKHCTYDRQKQQYVVCTWIYDSLYQRIQPKIESLIQRIDKKWLNQSMKTKLSLLSSLERIKAKANPWSKKIFIIELIEQKVALTLWMSYLWQEYTQDESNSKADIRIDSNENKNDVILMRLDSYQWWTWSQWVYEWSKPISLFHAELTNSSESVIFLWDTVVFDMFRADNINPSFVQDITLYIWAKWSWKKVSLWSLSRLNPESIQIALNRTISLEVWQSMSLIVMARVRPWTLQDPTRFGNLSIIRNSTLTTLYQESTSKNIEESVFETYSTRKIEPTP